MTLIAITVLHGLPGSGKGTLVAKLSSHIMNSISVTCGDLIRGEISDATTKGERFQSYLAEGMLIPDDIVSPFLLGKLDRIALEAKSIEFLIEGFPRTPTQAEVLRKHCFDQGWALRGVLALSISTALAMARVSTRRACSTCGAIYNLHSRPPRIPGHCDYDNTALASRPDETPDRLPVRFANYTLAYDLLSRYYHDIGVSVRDIDASQSVETVVQSALSAFSSLLVESKMAVSEWPK